MFPFRMATNYRWIYTCCLVFLFVFEIVLKFYYNLRVFVNKLGIILVLILYVFFYAKSNSANLIINKTIHKCNTIKKISKLLNACSIICMLLKLAYTTIHIQSFLHASLQIATQSNSKHLNKMYFDIKWTFKKCIAKIQNKNDINI